MKLRKNIEVHAVDAREERGRHHDERAHGQVEEQVVGTLPPHLSASTSPNQHDERHSPSRAPRTARSRGRGRGFSAPVIVEEAGDLFFVGPTEMFGNRFVLPVP